MPVEHDDVARRARARWSTASADELRAPARRRRRCRALGEGRVCDFCEARGLCRRDHWAEPTSDAAASVDARPPTRIDGRARRRRERFYAVACDPRRSVVVEACAGAGKTWMLVSRILRALLDGAPPHEILAITFTRKAAGEMRAAPRRVAAPSSPRRARRTSSACAALRRARRRRRRGARGARAGARRRCTSACSRPAARSRSAPSTPGSRSCCAPRRWRCSTGSACRRTPS